MRDANVPAPKKVFFFSGHMIDAPDRETPRFPPASERIARDAIARLLAQLNAGPADLGICSAACGGDLLFAETALERGLPLEIYLPFDVNTFALRSVAFAGGDWHGRFIAACAASSLHLMPKERGSCRHSDPYAQNNMWMLEAASRFGVDRVEFICLWDGRSGDGLGGTQHLMQQVRNRRCHSHWLDTTRLWT